MKFLIHLADGRKITAESPSSEDLRADMATAGIQAQRIEDLSAMGAVFPATTGERAMGQEPGFSQGLQDVLTIPTRAAGGAVSALWNEGKRTWPSARPVEGGPMQLGQAFATGMRSEPGAFLNDPSLVPSVMASAVAPELLGARLLQAGGKIAKPLAATLGGSLGGAGATEATAADPSMGRFAGNMALGTLLGGAGELARKGGVQAAKSALVTGIGNKIPAGSDDIVERAMQERMLPFFGGIEGFSQNAMSKVSAIADQLENLAEGGKTIDPMQVIREARNSIDEMAGSFEIPETKVEAARRTLDRLERQIMRPQSIAKKNFITNEEGAQELASTELTLKDARKFRGMLAEMARYEKGVNKLPGESEAAREVMRKTLEAEQATSPLWREKTSQMSPYMRMSQMADAQLMRGDNRQPMGARNVLGALLAGGFAGGVTQSPAAAAGGMLIGGGLGQLQNTIGGGRTLWELGNLLQRGAGVGQAVPRALGIYKVEQ